MNTDPAISKTLFDFQTETNSSAWELVNDDVMGGVSASQFQVRPKTAGIIGCAVFRGTVRLENNGGFASVRSTPVQMNLAGFTACVLSVRGDGHRYKFGVRTDAGFDAPFYQCSFATKPGEWEEHRLAFADFVPTFRGRVLSEVPPLNPARINSIGFLISDQQAGPFCLEIAWIKASSGRA